MKIKGGFTLIELVLVIAVMAILATLAITAVKKADEQKNRAYIDATRMALNNAIYNYRVREGRWPFGLTKKGSSVSLSFRNDNSLVFAPLIESSKTTYLDVSALLTQVQGKGVLPLKKALELKVAPQLCPIGYLDPANKRNFICFKVSINLELETVVVEK
jgi:prepilin-type N-terminal cleavage/methylation domain-containing protein